MRIFGVGYSRFGASFRNPTAFENLIDKLKGKMSRFRNFRVKKTI